MKASKIIYRLLEGGWVLSLGLFLYYAFTEYGSLLMWKSVCLSLLLQLIMAAIDYTEVRLRLDEYEKEDKS